MSTVFIGGSRHLSRLPAQAKERLNNVIENDFPVLVGDANGADKAVQRYLLDARYEHVTVFCSGNTCRNNLGQWKAQHVRASVDARGFQFYAAKDREMAHAADFGLMIWDGKSSGTLLNVLRLIRHGKKTVLLNVAQETTTTFKTPRDWETFLNQCASELRRDLRDRATPEEWQFVSQPPSDAAPTAAPPQSNEDLALAINAALASGDPKTATDLLGRIAKARGMSQVAKEAGLAREGLYRALSTEGNPEFSTVLKVMNAVGLRLMVDKIGQ